jgi:hypothetical protein
MWKPVLVAGLGGLLPTLSRLASTYATDFKTPLPEAGAYIALGLFFVIGAIMAACLRETDIRQAFVLGISAPAIITNTLTGIADGRAAKATAPIAETRTSMRATEMTFDRVLRNIGLPAAQAQTPQDAQAPVKTDFDSRCVSDLTALTVSLVAADDLSNQMPTRENFDVRFIRADGSIDKLIHLRLNDAMTVAIDRRVVSVAYSSGSARGVYRPVPGVSGVLTLVVQVGSKSGFIWALGGRRVFDTVDIKPVWVPTGSQLASRNESALSGKWVLAEWAGEYTWNSMLRTKRMIGLTGELWIHPVREEAYSGVLILCVGDDMKRVVENLRITTNGRSVVMMGQVAVGASRWDDDIFSMLVGEASMEGTVRSALQREKSKVRFVRET